MKELLCVIKYIIDTKEFGLKICPTDKENEWFIVAFSDSDYAGDKET